MDAVVPHVLAAYQHPAFRCIVKPGDQLHQRALCPACAADDADGLAGADGKIDILKDVFLSPAVIAEGYILEGDRAVLHFRFLAVLNVGDFVQNLTDPDQGSLRHDQHHKDHGNHHQAHEDLSHITDKADQLAGLHGAVDDVVAAEPEDGDDAGIDRDLHKRAVEGQHLFRPDGGIPQAVVGLLEFLLLIV